MQILTNLCSKSEKNKNFVSIKRLKSFNSTCNTMLLFFLKCLYSVYIFVEYIYIYNYCCSCLVIDIYTSMLHVKTGIQLMHQLAQLMTIGYV